MSTLTRVCGIPRRWFAGVALAWFAVAYLLPLMNRDLWAPDETRYAEISREMLQNGDWVLPRLLGMHYFEKPVAGYWLNNLSQLMFGQNPFAVRFASALCAGLTALALYGFAVRLFRDRRQAMASALCYLSGLLVYSVGTYSVLDTMVTLWMNLTLMLFFLTLNSERPAAKWGGYALMGVTAGMGFLTKGFIALAVPGIVALPWLLVTRRWGELRYLGVTLMALLAVSLPWALAVHRLAPDYWHYFFWVEHVQRFAGDDAQHKAPFWFYLPVLVLGTLPWLGFAPLAVWRGWQARHQAPEKLFLLLWLVVPLCFFSLAKGKLLTYILICFAPLALLCGPLLVAALDHAQVRRWRINGTINLVLGSLLTLVLLMVGSGLVGKQALYHADEKIALALGCLCFIGWAVCGAATVRWPQRGLWLTALCPLLLGLLLGWALPSSVIYSKLPGPFVEAHRAALVKAREIYVTDAGIAVGVGWFTRRDDIRLLNSRGELAYGLETSATPARRKTTEQFIADLPQARLAGDVAVLIRHEKGDPPTHLPLADERYTRERLTLLIYHQQTAD